MIDNKPRPGALVGEVALVTGGGRGIGKAIAIALAGRGAKVVVTGRDERALGETVGEIVYQGGAARHLAGDVRDAAHLRQAVSRAVDVFGGLHIVVANAGQSGRVDLGTDLERARAILDTNVIGAYQTLDAAAPSMGGPGRVVHLPMRKMTGSPARRCCFVSNNTASLQHVASAVQCRRSTLSHTCGVVRGVRQVLNFHSTRWSVDWNVAMTVNCVRAASGSFGIRA